MSLTEHAKDELTRAGLFNQDSDYDGMLGTAVLELIEKFAAQGHSGYSAHLTIDLFQRLAKFQTLTPITSDPSEWMCVSEYFEGKSIHQNRRNPAVFSNDGGKTWYNIDDLHNSRWFKIKNGTQRFIYQTGQFIKYKIFRAKRKQSELTIAEFAQPLPPEENDNASV